MTNVELPKERDEKGWTDGIAIDVYTAVIAAMHMSFGRKAGIFSLILKDFTTSAFQRRKRQKE